MYKINAQLRGGIKANNTGRVVEVTIEVVNMDVYREIEGAVGGRN